MVNMMSKMSVLGLSAVMLAASILPSQAMPLAARPSQEKNDVVDVQYWREGYGRPGYYGGYRGYRYERPGYRYHQGYWFPLAAFGAGALIGGAIASQPRYVEPAPAPAAGVNPRHYDWCAGRYRSYDPYSNTFQPNHGPRQQCYSPYY